MLNVEIDRERAIALLQPDGPLSQEDFEAAARIVDPFIEESGGLRGVVIYTRSFPGWDSFAGLISHLRFIRDHHRKVARLAFVTDSVVGDLAERIGNHFVAAEVRHFPFSELERAKAWIEAGAGD